MPTNITSVSVSLLISVISIKFVSYLKLPASFQAISKMTYYSYSNEYWVMIGVGSSKAFTDYVVSVLTSVSVF